MITWQTRKQFAIGEYLNLNLNLKNFNFKTALKSIESEFAYHMIFFMAKIEASFIVSKMLNISVPPFFFTFVSIKPNTLLIKAMPTTFRPFRSLSDKLQ
jgi:hypothetical protein